MDQINPFCFSVVCLFRNYPHRLMSFIMSYMFLSVVLLYRCFRCLYRKIIQSIGIVEESVSIKTNVTHPNEQHPTTRQSDTTEVCVYLNSDHGVLQSPLCEFVDLGSPPTYVNCRNIEHTPVGKFMNCFLFGMNRTALAVSTSNHPVLDIMALDIENRCTDSGITCPACAGKHRPHTYKEGARNPRIQSQSRNPRPRPNQRKMPTKPSSLRRS